MAFCTMGIKCLNVLIFEGYLTENLTVHLHLPNGFEFQNLAGPTTVTYRQERNKYRFSVLNYTYKSWNI